MKTRFQKKNDVFVNIIQLMAFFSNNMEYDEETFDTYIHEHIILRIWQISLWRQLN